MDQNYIEAITTEIQRLDADGDHGIEVEPHPAGVRLYDTQVSGVYDPAEVLATLRRLPDGAGFGETWSAIGYLTESV